MAQGHGDLIQPDRVDALIDFMRPAIEDLLDRLEPGEFTTVDFIDALRSIPEGREAYESALAQWGEGNTDMSRMVIHGQVIPGVLRRVPNVEWAGYAHGVADPYAVPAWWRLKNPDV